MDVLPGKVENALSTIMQFMTNSERGAVVADLRKETLSFTSETGQTYTANCHLDSAKAAVRDFCWQCILKTDE